MNKLVVILGPTASGKTDLAIKLAKFFRGEVINADSRQIYQEMNIGTNKPIFSNDSRIAPNYYQIDSKFVRFNLREIRENFGIIREVSGIPHYLIDVVKPNRNFTVTQFQKRALKIIKEIQKRGKIPFLVGGTGLYLRAVIDNLKIPKVPPDKMLRNKLNVKSNDWLFEKLKKLDPESASIIDRNNKRRLIRALEVCLKTKKKFSDLRKVGKPLFNVLQIGLKLPPKTLYKRINQRVEKMIKNGLVDEVEKLLKRYSPTLPSMSGIGYKEIILYLSGKISFEEVIEEIKKNTRHFARRQMTWFRHDKRIHWLKNYQEAKKIITKFLFMDN